MNFVFRSQLLSLCLAVAGGALAAEETKGIDLTDPHSAEAGLIALVEEWRGEVEQNPGPSSAESLGDTLQALGVVQRQLGKTKEAIESLTEAGRYLKHGSAVRQADVKEALALTYQDAGRMDEAAALLWEVVDFRRSESAPVALAHSLDHLAMNLLVTGHYTEVLALLNEALALVPPDRGADKAQLLGHISRYHHTLGSHARSIATLREALDLDFVDPELRLSLRSQLALGLLRLGKDEEAVEEFRSITADALELFEDRPLSAVPYINNLGSLALHLGNAADAADVFGEAVRLLEEVAGPDHPGLITPLNNLGVALLKQHRAEEAEQVLQRCLSLQERYLDPIHLRVTETRRNLAFAYLALDHPEAGEMVDRTTEAGLKLLEELVENGTESERLNFLSRFDLISLPCATGDVDKIASTLIASKGRLLDALLGQHQLQLPTTADVRSALPPHSAFIDICRYFPNADLSEARYGAVLYTPDTPPRWIPLGGEPLALRWIGALRERLQWQGAKLAGQDLPPPTLKANAILRSLHHDFWLPLEEHLPDDVRHIAWSPDGVLHFLPLAALLDAHDAPLCHRYSQVTTVGHARELLDEPPSRRLDEAPWTVVTVSDFPKPPPASEQSSPLLRLLASLEDMPGTRRESAYLKDIAPEDSVFFQDEEARETMLSRISSSPAVLHLGCHAFFLADARASAGPPIDFDDHSDLLFAGGLVLYQGAIRPFSGPPVLPDDDILFPSEIAHLPLSDTRLVTLSSCDSGNGTPVSGEGLLGLRRAFHLAGAREVAVALWPVSDRSTPAFMRDFYLRAVASGRPAQALWETQRTLIPRGDDPGFEAAVLRYAPFIISQSGPLQIGPPIPLPASGPPRAPLWIFVALATISLGFWLVRKRRRLQKP